MWNLLPVVWGLLAVLLWREAAGQFLLNRANMQRLKLGDDGTGRFEVTQQYQSALEVDSDNGMAYLALGTIDEDTGNWEGARTMLTDALSFGALPSLSHLYLGQAESALAHGESAVEHWRASGASLYFIRLAEQATRKRLYGRAEMLYRRAIAIAPDSMDNYGALGQFLETRGRPLEAADLYADEASKETSPLIRERLLGRAAMLRQNWDEAIRYYSELNQLDPTDGDAVPALGRAWTIGKRDPIQGDHWFQAGLALQTDQFSYVLAVGQVFMQIGDFPRGQVWLEQAKPRDQHDTSALELGLGTLAFDQAEYALALNHFDAALADDPANLGARHYRARSETQLGRWEDAIADYRECIRLDPEEWIYRSELGDLFFNLHQGQNAISEYQSALARLPPNGAARASHAHIVARLEELDSPSE